jgi:tetratricopeptide (TPR) repeat protein
MKKTIFPFLLFYFSSFAPAWCGPDLQDRFFGELDRHRFKAAGEVLRSWKRSSPGDPRLPASFGYYYYALAVQGKPEFRASPRPRDSIIATHPFAPEACAFRYGVRLERTLAQEARQSWLEAVQKDSSRLDLYLNLADLYQDEGDFEAQNHILGKALQFSDGSDAPMTWMGKGSLPLPQKRFLPRALQSYVDYYFSLGDPDADQKGYRLAKLLVTFYPSDPAGYNSMAAYFWLKGDRENALRCLLWANTKAPKDCLVLSNIAALMEAMHHGRVARIYWRKVVKLGNDPQWVGRAEEKLRGTSPEEEALNR